MIAALKAGKLDDVLAGTKWDPAPVVEEFEDTQETFVEYHGLARIEADAKANAAKVVVLEAALREMCRHLKERVSNQLESHEHFGDNPPSYLLAEKRDLDAAASLIEGGE